MRRPALSVAVVALAGATAVPASVPRSALSPPAGFTGGFGEPNCTHCHLGSEVNAFGGSVTLDGLPERYEPGHEYRLTVTLKAEETDVAGFQLTSRWADGPHAGANAGRLAPVDVRTGTKDSLGVTYAHQSPEGVPASPDRSGSSWALSWTAPEATGTVYIHVAANSGNADESPLGDLVYTNHTALEPGP
jgi:hypothetical protein